MSGTTDGPEGLFSWTCDLLRRGDPRANDLLPRLQRYPQHGIGWLALARTLRDLGQPKAALVAFDRSLAAASAPVEAALEKADLMIACGEAREAAGWLATVRDRWPADARLAHRQGRACYHAGALEAARKSLREAVGQVPDLAEAWFHLGLVEQDLRCPNEAIAAYRSALAACPDLFEAALNLGISLQATGAMEAALDAYARAVRLRPACFSRVAHALCSATTGRLWLDPATLRRTLNRRT